MDCSIRFADAIEDLRAITQSFQVPSDGFPQPGRLGEMLVQLSRKPLHLFFKRLAVVLYFRGPNVPPRTEDVAMLHYFRRRGEAWGQFLTLHLSRVFLQIIDRPFERESEGLLYHAISRAKARSTSAVFKIFLDDPSGEKGPLVMPPQKLRRRPLLFGG